jgi:hypothetical protein
MIQSYNDHGCLGPLAEYLQALVDEQHPALLELARRYPTHDALTDYIQSRPQRDDLGDPADGPRLASCSPTQRLILTPFDPEYAPNCFERTALWAAVAALIDPTARIQLATVQTPVGAHTLPILNGRKVRLDPRLTEESLDLGLALAAPGPVAIEPKKAVDWTIDLAGQQVARVRNGSMEYPAGSRAIRQLIYQRGYEPSRRDVDTMALVLALAERGADRYGTRAVSIVRTAARALAELLDVVLAQRQRRNASFDLAGLKFSTPHWMDSSATALGNFGLDIGGAVARKKIDALDLAALVGLSGGSAAVIDLLQSELVKQGQTLPTQIVKPPASLMTFAHLPRTT